MDVLPKIFVIFQLEMFCHKQNNPWNFHVSYVDYLDGGNFEGQGGGEGKSFSATKGSEMIIKVIENNIEIWA